MHIIKFLTNTGLSLKWNKLRHSLRQFLKMMLFVPILEWFYLITHYLTFVNSLCLEYLANVVAYTVELGKSFLLFLTRWDTIARRVNRFELCTNHQFLVLYTQERYWCIFVTSSGMY